MARRPKKPVHSYKKPVLLSALLVIIAAGVVLAVSHHKNVSVITSTNPAKQTSAAKSSATKNSSSEPNSDKSAASTGFSSPASQSTSTTGTLIAPGAGSLVSNHQPTASYPTEQSVCTTSPGAMCYIEFTMGSTVKKLQSQQTDSTGATYWSWDTQSAGLTKGSWDITVVAALNGQTKTAQDSLPLTVQ